ncbi:hypothetical protein SHKM778_10790 [Streptomyces sp. KM77-8]|uniref:Glutathionylspermidine synthase pre-ATP-grasp-like domain-containing protein n=1 Tax=Streptomyces haneummycinicus TaxID=3074435 RepID=A0AAT9HBC8_9ACTN
MERRTTEPRPGWQETVEEQGLIYPLTRYPDGSLRPYWDESAYYVFTLDEIEALEEVVEELHRMCLAAADHIVTADRFADLGITDPRIARLVAEAWQRRAELPPSTAASTSATTAPAPRSSWSTTPTPRPPWWRPRPPVVLDGGTLPRRRPVELPPRTPRRRLEEAGRPSPAGQPLYFAHSSADELGEDLMTVAYLKETAEQAGLDTDWISVEEIGWDRLSGRFVDNGLRFIRSIFKLYPWEWLTTDRFADHVLTTLDNGGGTGTTLWIEPAWKMLLSNKALLAILWELYPDHPHLLPTYLDGPRDLATTTGWVAKPLLGREGAGVTVHQPGSALAPAPNPAATSNWPPPRLRRQPRGPGRVGRGERVGGPRHPRVLGPGDGRVRPLPPARDPVSRARGEHAPQERGAAPHAAPPRRRPHSGRHPVAPRATRYPGGGP